MRILFMFQLNSDEKIENVFFKSFYEELPEDIHNKIKLLVNVLPPEKSFVGIIDVDNNHYVKSHQIRKGSIAVIEKGGALSEGDVFVDKDMNLKQYISEDHPDTTQLFFHDKHIVYERTDVTKNAWGIVRAILNVSIKDEPFIKAEL